MIGVTTTPSAPTRSSRVGVASVRMSRAARPSRAASHAVGTAASTPPTAAPAIMPGVRAPSSSFTMAPPKPNAPSEAGDRLQGDRPVDVGVPEVQEFAAEQGERQHPDARPADDQKDERPRGHDLHGIDAAQALTGPAGRKMICRCGPSV